MYGEVEEERVDGSLETSGGKAWQVMDGASVSKK